MITKIKFKKLAKNGERYISDGYACNGVWLFKIDWLTNLKKDRSTGIVALCNGIVKLQIAETIARLKGNRCNEVSLGHFVNNIDITNYKPLDLSTIDLKKGYFRGDLNAFNNCAMEFTQPNTPIIDIEFSPALFFDGQAIVMFKDEKSPLVILKNNEIMAMLMPLNFERFNSNK